MNLNGISPLAALLLAASSGGVAAQPAAQPAAPAQALVATEASVGTNASNLSETGYLARRTARIEGGRLTRKAHAANLANNMRGADLGPEPRALPLRGGFDVTAGADSGAISLRAVSVDSFTGSSRTFQTLSLTASAPIDEGADLQELANLTGFADSASLEFKLTHLGVSGASRRFNASAYAAICARAENVRRQWVEDQKETDTDHASDTCPAKVNRYLGAAGEQEYDDLFFDPTATARIFSLAAKVGRRGFDYFDPTTLAARSDTHTPWSVGGHLAFFQRGSDRLLTLSASHQVAYKAGDKRTACPPAVASPVVCVTGALGAPTRETTELVSLEFRQRFKEFAAAPTVTYDVRHDVWGVEAPVYLVTDAQGGLTAGVKFGWRSDDDDLRIGFFISKPFSLLTF